MSTLKYGSSGNEVKTLQTALKRAGCVVNVDGIFGASTATAVKKFQLNHGLTVDGIVGSRTWKKLYVYLPNDTQALGEAVMECLDAIEKLPEFEKLVNLIYG